MGKEDRRATVPIEEVVRATMIQEEALCRLLIRKGLLTKEEILEEIQAVRRETERCPKGPPT